MCVARTEKRVYLVTSADVVTCQNLRISDMGSKVRHNNASREGQPGDEATKYMNRVKHQCLRYMCNNI